MAEWVRAWDPFTYGHAMREVAGSNPGRGIIRGERVFHPTRQLRRFSAPNMPYIVNSKYN